MTITFGSLFAGIGGLDLGLERAGMKCVWQVEINDYARRVLAKHWPAVRRHDDVRTFPPAEGEWGCDLICGGFPCTDISNAGKRAGIDGEQSGLWHEFARIIGVVRPRYVLVENVAAILGRGMGRVLGDLAASGYDAEWDCIPAAAVGAPHIRDRLFLLAYPNGKGTGHQCRTNCGQGRRPADASEPETLRQVHGATCSGRVDPSGSDVPNPDRQSLAVGESIGANAPEEQSSAKRSGSEIANAPCCTGRIIYRDGQTIGGVWTPEPDVGRVAHGVSNRVDRLQGLGNAVVPQVAQWIGERIMEHERIIP